MSLWSSLAYRTSFSYRTSTFYSHERMTLASGCVRSRLAVLYLLDPLGRSDFSDDPSSGPALFPTTSTTMPAPNSYTKGSQMVEVGGTHTGDEAELARMGYKQELKCVHSAYLSILVF
jgi:hypothetical protein